MSDVLYRYRAVAGDHEGPLRRTREEAIEDGKYAVRGRYEVEAVTCEPDATFAEVVRERDKLQQVLRLTLRFDHMVDARNFANAAMERLDLGAEGDTAEQREADKPDALASGLAPATSAGEQREGRKLQINPAPLSGTGPRAEPDYDAGRCEAQLKNGAGRCLNQSKAKINDRWLCGVHEEAEGVAASSSPASDTPVAERYQEALRDLISAAGAVNGVDSANATKRRALDAAMHAGRALLNEGRAEQ